MKVGQLSLWTRRAVSSTSSRYLESLAFLLSCFLGTSAVSAQDCSLIKANQDTVIFCDPAAPVLIPVFANDVLSGTGQDSMYVIPPPPPHGIIANVDAKLGWIEYIPTSPGEWADAIYYVIACEEYSDTSFVLIESIDCTPDPIITSRPKDCMPCANPVPCWAS